MRWALATAALGVLLSGCGEASLTGTPAGPAHHRPSPPGQSAAANRLAARQEAARLLSLVRVPRNAVAMSTPPQSLAGPAMGTSAASSLVDRARFWRVSTTLGATMAWLRAHPPQGLREAGSTSGSAPSYAMVGVGYSEPDRSGMQDLLLSIGVATLPGGGSAIRADGMAVWLDPQPLRDDRTGPRLRVTVAGGCPGSDAGTLDVRADASDRELRTHLLPATSPTAALVCRYSGLNGRPAHHLLRSHRIGARAAGRLAKTVNDITLGHPVNEVMHCPMADGSATVYAFSYAGRADVDLWQDGSGCAFLTNGRIMVRHYPA